MPTDFPEPFESIPLLLPLMTAPTLNKIPGLASGATVEGSRESWRFSGACGASVLLHGVVFGVLAALSWAVKEAVELPGEFEVVPGSGTGGAAADGASPGADAPAREEDAAASGCVFVAPPSVPVWNPPVARETEAVAGPAPAPVGGRTTPVRAVPDRPEARRTSYRDYINQNLPAGPRRGSTPATPRSDAGAGAGLRISVPRIGPDLGDGRSSAGTTPAGEEMARYFAGLVRQLAERHEKPAGLSDLLQAEVSFTVAEDGGISDLRIVRSSGSAEFDRSVRDAFVRVTLPGRPDGKTDVRTLTFRMQDARAASVDRY